MKKPRILSRIFGLETKAAADSWSAIAAMFGAQVTTSGGVALSAETALKVPAVNSAIRLISEAVACLDIQIKEIQPDGSEIVVKDHEALALLKGRANDWTSGFELIRDLVIDGLTDDRGGVAWVNRGANGGIFELIRYRSGVVNVDFDQDTGQPSYKIGTRDIVAADMIHFREPFGRSPLTMAREAIGVAYVLERHAAQLFGKGARPSGALKFPQGMGEKAVLAARKAWRDTHEADGDSGKTAILYDGADFVPFTFTSTDAQFLENRKFQILEIARCFRVPPSMVFDLDRATWGNTEQMGQEFLIYCLEPRLRALEGALERALFLGPDRGRYVVRFDRDDMTRADLATRATTINSLVASKVLSANEGREWIGLGRREGGDTYENPNIATDTAGATDAAK
jgi:HK97 family phage portal protein